jgi:hypothetical protein
VDVRGVEPATSTRKTMTARPLGMRSPLSAVADGSRNPVGEPAVVRIQPHQDPAEHAYEMRAKRAGFMSERADLVRLIDQLNREFRASATPSKVTY